MMNTAVRVEADLDYSLRHLSNEALLASTRNQVGRSNQILATLLAHLAEVEARRLHRDRACSSLYTYCVYELRMSEDAALRRVHAARIARRFPVLFDRIAAGEIHLTGLLLLGPHLTEANQIEVLARAKHRTKREIAALVRMLDPLPDVPARIEPLGPAGAGTPRTPVASPRYVDFTAALCGPVRELSAGERPRDWIASDTDIAVDTTAESSAVFAQTSHSDGVVRNDASADENAEQDPARLSLAPRRYKVQFTATQEYIELLQEAQGGSAEAGATAVSCDELHAGRTGRAGGIG